MTPFSYVPRRRRRRCAAPRESFPSRNISAGGTNLVDLMRETVERPAAVVDVTGLANAIEEKDGGLLIGGGSPQHRDCRTSAGSSTLSGPVPCNSRRRFGANPQTWRRWAATSFSVRAAPIFTTMKARACNKRQPGQGCDAFEGFQPHARDPWRLFVMRCHPSLRHVRRTVSARRRCASCVRRRPAHHSADRLSLSAGMSIPTSRRCCGRGELITAV